MTIVDIQFTRYLKKKEEEMADKTKEREKKLASLREELQKTEERAVLSKSEKIIRAGAFLTLIIESVALTFMSLFAIAQSVALYGTAVPGLAFAVICQGFIIYNFAWMMVHAKCQIECRQQAAEEKEEIEKKIEKIKNAKI